MDVTKIIKSLYEKLKLEDESFLRETSHTQLDNSIRQHSQGL